MAASESSTAPAVPISFIELSTKPGAKIAHSFIPSKGTDSASQPLLVFLNGLGLPAASWLPTISLLVQTASHPNILSYDRYGQGLTTDKDPNDAKAADPQHPHDCMDSVRDLHQLLSQLSLAHNLDSSLSSRSIFFVCNSIGCALARLYAQTYPGSVSALLFLDSVIANSDFVSFMPDPDAADFKEKYVPLPEGVTEESIKESRAKFFKIFSPFNGVMGKAEGLSRKTLPGLLPDADAPILEGFGGKGPWVTVVGHGFEAFAAEGVKVSRIDGSVL
jgi:pimeloyl-ACP methyl ester carboxylesterase